MTHPQVEAAADAFSTALVRWRAQRRMTKKQLATEMGFDPSYVSHVEARRHRPTEDFARRAERVLNSGGLIWQRYRDYDDARQTFAPASEKLTRPPTPTTRTPASAGPGIPEQWVPAAGGVLIEAEESTLVFDDGMYHCHVRREVYNAGAEPVTRYPIRIAVDRYPGEPERSNRHHREHPLRWEELNLVARCGSEPMRWQCRHDRDAFKEVWLLFENDEAQFPLYPGRRATVAYSYTVGADKWGHWFQRAVRMPTRHLTLRLDLPAQARPVVWGTAGSPTTESRPLQTPLRETGAGLSAPQLGIGWAVAVILPADGRAPIELRNPRVVAESVDHDEQLEGCLSFFDVRGRVARPMLIEVEHSTVDAVAIVSTFTDTMARVVAHSIDHLGGLLYPDRMPADGRLVPALDLVAAPDGQ